MNNRLLLIARCNDTDEYTPEKILNFKIKISLGVTVIFIINVGDLRQMLAADRLIGEKESFKKTMSVVFKKVGKKVLWA